MTDHSDKRHQIGKWIIGIITCCILIFLALRHINILFDAIVFLVTLAAPLFLGGIFALMFNVPMSSIERQLKKRTHMTAGLRPLSIILAFLLVLGLFIGITVLVIPELANALKLILSIVNGGLDDLAAIENNTELMSSPIGSFLIKTNIDWAGLKTQLEELIGVNRESFVNHAVDATKSMLSGIVTIIIALVFSVYILSCKEKLKHQCCRLVRVWLPEKLGEPLIHICAVCSNVFRLFITGQAMEAMILGTLCMFGMMVLRIPYAPMIGALVGVTALIPVVGAYVGAIVGAIMILTVEPFKAFVFLIFLIILQQVEGNMIYPRVVGAKINLPAMWVLAAVVVGGNLGGPIGMLLGVPTASAAYALLREATNKREQSMIIKQNGKQCNLP